MQFVRIALVSALLTTGLALAQAPEHATKETAPATAEAPSYLQKAAYPLTKCIVSGKPLAGDTVKTFEAGGRTFMTCCGKCKAKIEKDPEKYAAKLDAAILEAQLADYPLTVCPISGNELGAKGEPHRMVIDGTLVQLCCPKCVDKATAQSAAIVKRIQDARYAAQRASYPLTTCVVSGEDLDEDAQDVMFGTTLVRFCCEKCIAKFEKNPAAFLAKIDAARKQGMQDAKPEAKPAGAHEKASPAEPKQAKEGSAAGAGKRSCCDGGCGDGGCSDAGCGDGSSAK